MKTRTRLYAMALLGALMFGAAYARPQATASLTKKNGTKTNSDPAVTPMGKPGVTHDSTLIGDGSSGSPLGVAVPIVLSGQTATNDAILKGLNAGSGIGVQGSSGSGVGVKGNSSFIGVSGESVNVGVFGSSPGGAGVYGSSPNGVAGFFVGDVQILGNVSKSGGSFKIDHPVDPENKYLSHSFVESPDMMNVYNGNITTDAEGVAMIELPDYFESLNRDFRYQLTVIGQFAQAIVSGKVKDNRFTIRTSVPNVEVSWQVTGIRQDAWANKHRIKVEEQKTEPERGYYLHPDAFSQPEERGVEWMRQAELMNQMKRVPRKQQ